MIKFEARKRWAGSVKALAIAGLSLLSLISNTAVFAEEEDRPVIKVPRGGGRELFQNCVLCHKYDGRGGSVKGVMVQICA